MRHDLRGVALVINDLETGILLESRPELRLPLNDHRTGTTVGQDRTRGSIRERRVQGCGHFTTRLSIVLLDCARDRAEDQHDGNTFAGRSVPQGIHRVGSQLIRDDHRHTLSEHRIGNLDVPVDIEV